LVHYRYSKLIAGKGVLKVKGPSGLDFPLQTAFWQNNITMWNPTTATAGVLELLVVVQELIQLHYQL
jgi:hypothetical protein